MRRAVVHSCLVRLMRAIAAHKALAEKGVVFDKVFVSPARRARMTCEIICDALHYIKAPETRNELYFEGVDAIMQCVRSAKAKHRTIAVFGHNPDFTRCVRVSVCQLVGTTVRGVWVDVVDRQLHPAAGLQRRRFADGWCGTGGILRGGRLERCGLEVRPRSICVTSKRA